MLVHGALGAVGLAAADDWTREVPLDLGGRAPVPLSLVVKALVVPVVAMMVRVMTSWSTCAGSSRHATWAELRAAVMMRACAMSRGGLQLVRRAHAIERE